MKHKLTYTDKKSSLNKGASKKLTTNPVSKLCLYQKKLLSLDASTTERDL
jgi:hypothetical protein